MKKVVLSLSICCMLVLRPALLFSVQHLDYGLPNGTNTHLIVKEREGYAIGYDIRHKQPLWVAYRLTDDMLKKSVINRTDDFREDDELRPYSALLGDYRGSGYDRGHLCPARDMEFSTNATSESFLLSNMSPQHPMFNRGIWKDLEDWVRKEALKEKSIYIMCGPYFSETNTTSIGKSKVSVPDGYWKIVLDETPPVKTIGFILQNRNYGTKASLSPYSCSVEKIEKMTGLNFFSLIPSVLGVNLKKRHFSNGWIFPIGLEQN